LDQKIDELQKQLRSAVDANEFEKAAQLRDEIAKLKEEREEFEKKVRHASSNDLTVTDQEVAEVVSAWTGIPVTQLEESERKN